MRSFVFILALLAAALLLAGCTYQQAQPAQPQPSATQAAPVTTTPADTVRESTTPLGTILTDTAGKTLYVNAKDVPFSDTSACTGGCSPVWPPFSAGTIRVSAPLAASDFSSFTRSDGMSQTVYKGRPLYFYQPDASPGDTRGQGIGGIWFVADVNGNLPATPTPSPTTFHTLSPYGGGAY